MHRIIARELWNCDRFLARKFCFSKVDFDFNRQIGSWIKYWAFVYIVRGFCNRRILRINQNFQSHLVL